MSSLTRSFFLLFLFLFSSCASKYDNLTNPKEDIRASKGNMIYSYGSGRMQCKSEIDSKGQIAILLNPLKKNTIIQFIEMLSTNKRNTSVLRCRIIVNEETDLCAAWQNVKELYIEINPRTVKQISLTGEIIFNSKRIKVFTSQAVTIT